MKQSARRLTPKYKAVCVSVRNSGIHSLRRMASIHNSADSGFNAPSRPLLQVRDLEVTFRVEDGLARAVDGVSFDLEAGEVLGIVPRFPLGQDLLLEFRVGQLVVGGLVVVFLILFTGIVAGGVVFV